MNIYIDESGSINNKGMENYFIITLIVPARPNSMKRSYKRFISSRYDQLEKLDLKHQKMFKDGRFQELKGSCFDRCMKKDFVQFFCSKNNFSVLYIVADNSKLNDIFCSNTSRAFNYLLKKALEYFIKRGCLESERHMLQLDERNERTESKFFLEDYLNTELFTTGINSGNFTVQYFDSARNANIQIADVFSNLYYSHLKTQAYYEELSLLREKGILTDVFRFPL